MSDAGTAGLLDEMSSLRKRTRRERRGYWFPLLVFGLLTLGAIPLMRQFDWENSPTRRCDHHPDGRVSSCSDQPPDTAFEVPGFGRVDPLAVFNSGFIGGIAHPLALGLYWLGVLVLGFLATVWWYRWRAARVGVETSTRAYAQVTLYGLAVLLLVPLISAVTGRSIRLSHWEQRFGSVALVLLSLGAVLVAMRLSKADRAPSRRRRVLGGVAVAFTVLVVATLAAATIDKTGGLMLIAIGLLTLAVLERSAWCTVVAVAFTGVTLLANISYMGTIFYRLNWEIGPRDTNLLFNGKDVVLPGAVLIIGGVVALVGQWWTSRSGRTG
ncbi:hypothetical protein ABZ816_00915 [Actinosynnema sp. NPDC047251]|uniref:Uncharacterized protein n=1 Tax=Saccharothrix espanaensis (strain ATCC 51144 / DSM 44229 / JCM 9112 / NBRC 15066 / NRRL 15764) TaxID=1179773 RepID=K0JSU5_SACES|nr:hypothetical protein [Saccharothrix espanaensis]CCH30810.1 hypothetical protein BN6_35120 [Saccharothrix espanaensis DSM 44229]